MKKSIFLYILLLISLDSFSKIVSIAATAGNKFNPDSVVIRWGDTIQFTNMAGHSAIEVTSTAWNANGKTAAGGGFNTNSMGNTITNLNLGLHYYVDTQFVSSDTMKGRIWVLPRIAALSDCNDLFISEYIEGSGNNKALEIFNPSSAVKSLTGYSLALYSNGSMVATNTTALTGSINPDTTFVFVNSSAVVGMIAKANATNSTTINFNGDDAIALLYNNTIVDVFGEIGQDPGTYWVMNGTDSSKDMTFIRKPAIKKGNTNWANSSASDWISYPKDTFSNLADHLMNACAPLNYSSIEFVKIADTVIESIASKIIQLKITTPNPTIQSVVQVQVSGGTANGSDYSYTTQVVTFPAGSSAIQSFAIGIVNDINIENMENILLKIRNPANAGGIGIDSVFTLNIQDNDTLKAFFNFANSTVIENNININVGVKLNAFSPNPTKVKMNTPSGTASNISDYVLLLDSVTFAANDTATKNFTVSIKEDINIETDETIFFDFNATNNASVIGQIYSITIQDEDTLKAQFIKTNDAFNEGAGTAQIGIKLTAFSPNATSVSASIIGGTASVGVDFTPIIVTANFAANDTATKYFTASINDDLLIEGDENLTLGISSTNNAITAGQQYTGTIVDNDFPPILQFSSISSNISEGAGTHSFQVKLNYSNSNPTSVNIGISGGTASGSDYSLTTTTINFAANDSTPKNVSLNLIDDISIEGIETIKIKFINPTNSSMIGADSIHTVSILDNDTLKAFFTKASSSFNESSGSVQIGVKLNSFSSNLTSINATIAGGTATGADYSMTTSSVNFPANDTSTKYFVLNIIDDGLFESNESIIFNLTGNNGAITIGESHTLTIVDNETNQFNFASTAITKTENSGSSNYSIKLASPIGTVSSVDVSLIGTGSASNSSDFTFSNQTVNFPASSTSQNISLNILNDILVEGNETILLKLSNPTGGIILGPDSTLTITIQDNDTLKAFFGVLTNTIKEGSTTHKIPVKLSAFYNAITPVNIGVYVSGTNTATLNTDYSFVSTSINIPANDTNTYYFDLNTIDDINIEVIETGSFEISSVGNGGLKNVNQYVLNITDNDTLKVQFINPSSNINESIGTAQFGVKLNAFSPNSTTVNANFTNGSAASPADFNALTNVLNFNANDTSTKYFSANIIDDLLPEINETFTIGLSANNSAITAGQIHTATIIDNDIAIIPRIKFAVPNSIVNENTSSHSLLVKLNNAKNSSTTVGITVIGGTASGADYTLNTSSIVFNANDSSDKLVSISINNDILVEPIETIQFKLSNPTNGAILVADSIHTVNILDNDTLKISFINSTSQYLENFGIAKLGVKIANMSSSSTTVTISPTGGNANSSDYTFASQTITWAANDTVTKFLNIPIINDNIDENNETVIFTLSNPNNSAIIVQSNHSLSIIDNDTTITSSILNSEILGLKMYPNPIRIDEIMHIESAEAITRIKLINEIGQVVKEINEESSHQLLLFEDCSKGIFILEIHTVHGILRKKIILE